MKITCPGGTLLITPDIENYLITLDGTELNVTESIYHESFGLTRIEDSNTIVYFGKYYGGSVIYNGYQLLLEIPKIDIKPYGKCF